jgi:hypothetical protein
MILNRVPRSLRRLAVTPRVAEMTLASAGVRLVPTAGLHKFGNDEPGWESFIPGSARDGRARFGFN